MTSRTMVVLSCLVMVSGCVEEGTREGFTPVLLNDCGSDVFYRVADDPDLAVENFLFPGGPYRLGDGNFTGASLPARNTGYFLVWSADRHDPDPEVVEVSSEWTKMQYPTLRVEVDCVTLTELHEGDVSDTDGRRAGWCGASANC